jgi:hypothetical protein
MKSFFQRLQYPFFLLLVAFGGYFWFLHFAPIYDFADEFFPGRFFMSETIRNGIFPLWIPYQSMGLPVHGDPQAGTFYLPLWIISIFTTYSPFTWGIEYMFHAFMGGVGFFMFAEHFTNNKEIRFIAAIIFMLSGFYIGNVQHISWIIAATWIPWILWTTIHFLKNPNIKNGLFIALFFSLLFSGGYPGFWIITFYIILVLGVYYLIIDRKIHDKKYFKSLIINSLILIFVLIILILPALISFLEIKNYITRGIPLAYDLQISCSYSPKSFLSLFFPFIACTESAFIENDISMASIYVGITALPFLIAGLTSKQNQLNRFFIGLGIIALLLSMGKYLPFHRWAFHLIPFINMMRLPSIFRLFVIIPLIILIIKGIELFLVKNKTKTILISTLIIVIGILITILLTNGVGKFSFFEELKSLTWQNSISKPIGFKLIMHGFIQMMFLVVLLFICIKKRHKTNPIIVLLLADLLFNGAICLQKTGYMPERTNQELADFLQKEPQNYIIPNEITSSNQIFWKTPYPSLWRNLGIYSKQIEWFSYKGVILKNFELMTNPNQRKGEELYFPKVVFYPEEVIYSESAIPITVQIAYSKDRSLVKSYIDSTSELTLTVFRPGKIAIKTKNKIERPVVISQSFYPGWKAKTENGKMLKIKPLNSSMLSVMVPKGEHTISLYYTRPELIFTFILQVLGYLIILLLFITNQIRNRV